MRIAAGLILALALLAAGGGGRAMAALQAGPSFDCAGAADVEAAICRDPVLSADDRRLQAFYARARPGVLGNGSDQLAVQRRWLKDRDAHCAQAAWRKSGAKTQRDCIASAYDERLGRLAVAALLASPTDSLAEIRRTNPAAAPIYEALAAYVTLPDPAARTRKVEALLAPAYGMIDAQTRAELQDRKEPVSPKLAAASDSGFALFFDVSAMFGGTDLTWPCAALLRRPGLVEGLGPFWGGAIDGQVPGSDCAETLPPAPEVEALGRRALDAQPVCDGTIRFSTGRGYAQLLDAIRMHRTEIWRTGARGTAPGRAEARFRAAHKASIAAADQALAAYYRRVFAVPAAAAGHDARTGLDALVAAAFGLCD
jgi:uncharacterized protein